METASKSTSSPSSETFRSEISASIPLEINTFRYPIDPSSPEKLKLNTFFGASKENAAMVELV